MIPDGADPALRAKLLDPAVMAPPLLWLASQASHGVTGMRFNASLWPAGADAVQAAAASGQSLLPP